MIRNNIVKSPNLEILLYFFIWMLPHLVVVVIFALRVMLEVVVAYVFSDHNDFRIFTDFLGCKVFKFKQLVKALSIRCDSLF